jgi:hypothetical protein
LSNLPRTSSNAFRAGRTAEFEDEDECGDSKEGRSLEGKKETLNLKPCNFTMKGRERQNGAGPVSIEAALVTSRYLLRAKQRFVLKADKRALQDR